MSYQWDFSKVERVSFRKGGRVVVVRKDGSEENIAPEDQAAFKRQYEVHLGANMDDFLNDPRWGRK